MIDLSGDSDAALWGRVVSNELAGFEASIQAFRSLRVLS